MIVEKPSCDSPFFCLSFLHLVEYGLAGDVQKSGYVCLGIAFVGEFLYEYLFDGRFQVFHIEGQ